MIGLSLAALDSPRAERLLATVAKNGSEEIRITLREVDGRQMITVRVWAEAVGQLVPTKAGFNLAPEAFRDFINGLRNAYSELDWS